MVEIRHGEHYEVVDLAGLTVSEAREKFRAEYGIPDRAVARLNGHKVKGSAEPDTVINDDDRLTFAADRSRLPYLVGALLLALAVTGSVFAYGFINSTATITATMAESNFAEVSTNDTAEWTSDNMTWHGFGFFKGTIAGAALFDIEPAEGYTGDLAVTVTLGNAADLAKRYRVLAMQLEIIDASDGSANTTLDINESGVADDEDWVVLTLDNGSVSMFPKPVTTNLTVNCVGGFYITHVRPLAGWAGSASPDLFCEVAQR